MKENFQVSNEFHEKFKETLDMIRTGQGERKTRRNIRRMVAVVASVVIVAFVTMFTANATGIINLDETFKSIFGIENDESTQQVALDIASAPLEEATSAGVTAKVVQAVNDSHGATILVEFYAQDKILNRDMGFGSLDVKVSNARMSVMSAGMITEDELNEKQTIEEFRAMMDQERAKLTPNDMDKIGAEDETQKYLNEAKDRYAKNYSNKIYAYISFSTVDSMSGKNIKISMNKLDGLTEESESKVDYKTIVDGSWEFNWKLSSKAQDKTFDINKEYNGVYIKQVTLSPISANILYGNNTPIESLVNEDGEYKSGFMGVRFKNGKTRALHGGGSNGRDGQSVSFGYDIINVDDVVSVFMGNNFTEIPLE